MKQVIVHEAKTHLSKLIQEVLDGEEVLIARRNTPVVRLFPLAENTKSRRIGGARDIIGFIADDFDEPLDDLHEYMD
ncbi:MAG: type II toxin-antitoxin system Phd/YefM family antitoxin [Desulfohalobiaceae bacterium]